MQVGFQPGELWDGVCALQAKGTSINQDKKLESVWRVQIPGRISQSPLFLAWLVNPLLFSPQLPVNPASPAASPGLELWPFLQNVMLYSMQLPPLPCMPAVLPTWPYFSPYYSNIL